MGRDDAQCTRVVVWHMYNSFVLFIQIIDELKERNPNASDCFPNFLRFWYLNKAFFSLSLSLSLPLGEFYSLNMYYLEDIKLTHSRQLQST